MIDPIERQAAIDAAMNDSLIINAMDSVKDGDIHRTKRAIVRLLASLPHAQSEEVTPHRNYKYLSDYWCECGNHLGKKGSVTFCSDCGRKVKWDE